MNSTQHEMTVTGVIQVIILDLQCCLHLGLYVQCGAVLG